MGNKNSRKIFIDSGVSLVASINSNEICDAANNSDSDLERTEKFSCWDVINPAWLNDAKNYIADRIYVHGEILEWIVELINKNVLNENLRANVEEVHHHNLDGPVYLIKFYLHKSITEEWRMKCNQELDALRVIQDQLKYKMSWKTNPTYFLRVDSNFEDRKVRIISKLKQINLHKFFHTTSFVVNWLCIPKIEIYEFFVILPKRRIDQIDSIFEEISESEAAIYICDQFCWHHEIYNYIEVDKVAMDICAEEWSRYDLLKDFAADNILELDLANKDYRDPYFNVYLDRYLDKLLKKCIPQLASDHKKELAVPLYRLDHFLSHYFVSRFYDKISTLLYWNPRSFWESRISSYDIPIVLIITKSVNLNGNQPPPEHLMIMMDFHQITYIISNYTHFSDSLFRALLNKPYDCQTYKINFDSPFNFIYENDQRFLSPQTSHCKWTSDNKMIIIELENCNENNVELLINFVNYLIDLFNERKKLDVRVEVSLCFTNCRLEDYSFLENIGNSIDHIQFEGMIISPQQIRILSCALTQQSSVTLYNCREITDNNIMTLLENIDFDRIWINGKNACTPTLYFLMAEHLMTREGVDTIKANRFTGNMLGSKYNFYFNYAQIEFFKDGCQIVARDSHSKEIVDIYCCITDMIMDNISLQQRIRYNKPRYY